MNRTGIEYLDFSWNPIAMRCTPVSEGCANCWHQRMADRLAGNKGFPEEVRKAYAGEGPPVLIQKRLEEPLRRKKPTRFGVQFMGDLFHDSISTNFIHRVFDNMFYAPWHTFLVLTKRLQRMAQFVDVLYHRIPKRPKPIQNIYLGVSVENQATADKRREYLRQTPAAVKFVSYEPALSPVDWTGWEFVDQIISGGESGPRARPSHPNWHRATRDFCQENGIAYFFKGWGAWFPRSQWEDNPDLILPDDCDCMEGCNLKIISNDIMHRVGKKCAGCLLDGVLHREYPREEERRS